MTRGKSSLSPFRNPLDVHQVVAQVVDEVQIANPEREIVITHEGEGRGARGEEKEMQTALPRLSPTS